MINFRSVRRRASLVLAAAASLMFAAGTVPANATPATSARHGATVVDEHWVADRQLDLTVRSPALGEAVKVRLLTPDGWRSGQHGKRWP
ncbi:MAG TPA: hypothetical protein VIP98_06170, partial [Microlunatus sp.]